jgi:hypothetical protein
MITSTRQYEITRTRTTEVRNTLAELQGAPIADMLQLEMHEFHLAALRGTRHDLEAELADYDRATRTKRI